MKWLDGINARRESRGQNSVGESLGCWIVVLSIPAFWGAIALWVLS